jgi:hypothetical protein
MTATSHHFPAKQPRIYRLSQAVLMVTAVILAVSAPLQVILALNIAGAGMFIMTALLSLALMLPLILMSSATPPVTISREGLTVQPWLGRTVVVPWSAVKEVKPYSLMPPEDSETVRRAMVGRKKYRGATGLMLVCEGLPWRYRVVGAFAGEGFAPVVAITNRSHADYDQFVYLLNQLRA